VIIKYTPTEAKVIVSTAILTIENEPPKVIKLSAIGKYPYITANIKKLDFESILVGTKKSKEVLIKNES